jgi:hypothetical protein
MASVHDQEKPSHRNIEAACSSNHSVVDMAEKPGPAHHDVGLVVFQDGHVTGAGIDPKAERRLVRKIDMFIIPFICVTYLITYIDKATLSYGMFVFFTSPFLVECGENKTR